jgi:hypothetical protein
MSVLPDDFAHRFEQTIVSEPAIGYDQYGYIGKAL